MTDKRISPGKGSTEERYRAFADAYVTHNLNATAAAIEVGYSPKTATSQASSLLAKPSIQEMVRERLAPRLDRLSVDADRVIQEAAKLAFSNIADFVEVDPVTGRVVIDFPDPGQPDFLTKMAALEAIEQEEYTEGHGEGAESVRKTKFRLAGKRGSLELLAKILGMLKDRVEHGGAVAILPFDVSGLDQGDRDALRGILERQKQKRLEE